MVKDVFISKEDFNLGGSAFWGIFILIALMSLSYLFIWSFFNNSVKGVVIGVVMFALIISGIVLSRFEIFKWASFEDNALSFTLGFGLWSLVGTMFGQQSIFTVTENYLFSTVASELPQVVELVSNVFIIPIAEELFWLVGIPFTMYAIYNSVAKKKGFEFFGNKYFQIITIIIVSSLTFAFFHVGKQNPAFILAGIVFRAVILFIVLGELQFNLIKGANIVAGFGLGSHIANNLIFSGWSNSILILSSDVVIFSIVIVLFAVIFITGIIRLVQIIGGAKVEE